MENKGYQQDSQSSHNAGGPPSYQETSPADEGPRQCSLVQEEMDALRAKLDANVYNAVLDHGEMPPSDMFKLVFLIAFPTVFFLLAVILMAVDES